MKKLILILALIAISQRVVFSQGCLPEGIDFTTQEQIDNFQTNYPGCTEIEGDVWIEGNAYITNLYGLDVITSVGGDLYIFGNLYLPDLTGLNALTSIGGDVIIGDSFVGNVNLGTLEGLNSLTFIGGNVHIWVNSALISFNGLESLTTIGGILEINFNENLTEISKLANLTSVGGSILIIYNYELTSLEGLDNINPGSITDLSINQNFSLSACDVQSICEYLVAPNGTIEIHDNAIGCNSQAEVEAACLTSVEEKISNEEISLFPNPATSFITINVNEGLPIEEAIIYNHLGQKALVVAPVNNTVDVSGLKPGIYFIEVITSESHAGTKLVIE